MHRAPFLASGFDRRLDVKCQAQHRGNDGPRRIAGVQEDRPLLPVTLQSGHRLHSGLAAQLDA